MPALLANLAGPRNPHRALTWYASPDRVSKLRYVLERLDRWRQSTGTPVVVALLPVIDEGEFDDAYALAERIVQHELDRLDLEAWSLRAVFQEALATQGAAELNQHAADIYHFGPGGHALIADEFAARLRPHPR